MATPSLSNATVSEFLWNQGKEIGLNPATWVFGGAILAGAYLWFVNSRIEKRAKEILKDIPMPPTNLKFLHRAIRQEHSFVVIRVLENLEDKVMESLKKDREFRSNFFELEMGEKQVTSLIVAGEEGKYEVIRILVEIALKKPFFNADLKSQQNYLNWISQQDQFGATALHKIMYRALLRSNTMDHDEKAAILRTVKLLQNTHFRNDALGHLPADYAQKLEPLIPGISRKWQTTLTRSADHLGRR